MSNPQESTSRIRQELAQTTKLDPKVPQTTTPSHSAFFYGTLMAPQVLSRVCQGFKPTPSPQHLSSHPATLFNHRRHRVKGADYPAVLPHPGNSVRGTYVSGLTQADIWRLDIFEGSEYTREKVTVTLLDLEGDGEDTRDVEAETYIWSASPDLLEESEWDFDEFKREKMRFWVGSEGEGEYAEVDEAVAAAANNDGTGGRGVNGHIAKELDDEIKKNAV